MLWGEEVMIEHELIELIALIGLIWGDGNRTGGEGFKYE